MAYNVDWIGKIVSIPTSDLVLVSGDYYRLIMTDFLGEIRRLEAAFAEGLWAPQILKHDNPRLDFVGANYAGFDELINGYTIQFVGSLTRVDLVGSNNDIVDVLIPTGVAVVPSNTAGLQRVETGSGLSSEQSTMLEEIWRIAGLDLSAPMTVTQLERIAGAIKLAITGDGATTSTVTRQ